MTRHAVFLALLLPGLAACAHAGSPVPPAASTPVGIAPHVASTASAHPPDPAIDRLVPAGMVVQSTYPGDLDGDGDMDLLVVLQRQDPAHARVEPRALLVLGREADGHWTRAALGVRAILCVTCGGMMGDPLASVDVGREGFDLRFEGGSRELWSSVFRFGYDAARATWVLTTVERKVLDRLDGSSRQRSARAADFGLVTLDGFDASDASLVPLD